MIKLLAACLIVLSLSPGAYGFCFEQAAAKYGVNPLLLWGIAKVESNFNPYALGYKDMTENRWKSVFPKDIEEAKSWIDELTQKGWNFDLGIGQINRRNIESYGINPYDLLDACYNIHWSAFILRGMIDRWGYSWEGISHYNGGGMKYSVKVWKAIEEYAQDDK